MSGTALYPKAAAYLSLEDMDDHIRSRVRDAIRATARRGLPKELRAEHSFVNDLGFDSMTIALLAVALEERFGRAILLDEWIAGHSHPDALTIESLCSHLEESLGDA